jgi:hypothetical protein
MTPLSRNLSLHPLITQFPESAVTAVTAVTPTVRPVIEPTTALIDQRPVLGTNSASAGALQLVINDCDCAGVPTRQPEGRSVETYWVNVFGVIHVEADSEHQALDLADTYAEGLQEPDRPGWPRLIGLTSVGEQADVWDDQPNDSATEVPAPGD